MKSAEKFKVLIVLKGSRVWLNPLFCDFLKQLEEERGITKVDLLCYRNEKSQYDNSKRIHKLFLFPEQFTFSRLTVWIDLAEKIRNEKYDYLAIMQDNYFGFNNVRLYLFSILASGGKKRIYKFCGPVHSSKPVKGTTSGLDFPCQGKSVLWNIFLIGLIPISQILLILGISFFGISRKFLLTLRRSVGINQPFLPEKMNILLVEGTLELGGNQEVESLITDGLVKRGHKVIVVVLNSGPYYSKLLEAGASQVICHDKNGEIHKNRWLVDVSLMKDIFQTIHRESINVVNMSLLTGYRMALLPALMACTSGIIGMETSGDVVEWKKYELFLRAFFVKFMDIIYVDSRKEMKELTERYISHKKCQVINTGVDFQQLDIHLNQGTDSVRQEFAIPEKVMILGIVTRFVKRKGVQNIIRAVPTVIKKHSKIIFLLVGDGFMRTELEELVDSLNLKNYIIFTGFRTDYQRLINSMDIYVHPARGDGNSISIITAMALGKPIIGAEAERYIEESEPLINGETGIVLQWNDIESLSRVMLELIEKPALRQRLGESAKTFVHENYTLETMIDNVEKLYRKLL